MGMDKWSTSGQHPWVKFVELFLVANAVAAVLSLGLAPGSEDWFTWTIVPDASARLLAVMYANAVVLGMVALRQPDWARARAIFVLITVFAVAATTMTFFQLDPFLAHPWFHLTYWLSGYAVLVATAPAILVWQERSHGGRLPVRLPMTPVQRATGALAALVMGGVAGALLIDPGAFSSLWPWQIAPLVGRLLGVWLAAFAVAYAWALWDGDWDRARPLYLAAPVTGLLLALVPPLHAGAIETGAPLGAYYAFACAVALPGLGLLPQRAAAAAAGPARPTNPDVRAGLLAIAGVIVLLGLSLFCAPRETDRLFAWTIANPLTAAFLGASYLASTALAVACAAEREWARGRAFAAPYLIAGVALLAVTFIHLDEFHMDSVTGWAWLVLYAIFPPATVLLLGRQLRTPGGEPPPTAPMSRGARGLLAAQGAVMVALGTALTLAPHDAAVLWPWPLTALAAQAIGVFVLAQGALVLTACREGDWGRVRPAMLQYVVLAALHLIAIARFPDVLDWDVAGAWLYLAWLVVVLATALYGARRALAARRRERAGRAVAQAA
jgi:hypothetical protein